MATADELKNLIEEFASDLAKALPDPATWGIWLEFFFEELEKQAAENGQPVEKFDMALELLQRAIGERLVRHQ